MESPERRPGYIRPLRQSLSHVIREERNTLLELLSSSTEGGFCAVLVSVTDAVADRTRQCKQMKGFSGSIQICDDTCLFLWTVL